MVVCCLFFFYHAHLPACLLDAHGNLVLQTSVCGVVCYSLTKILFSKDSFLIQLVASCTVGLLSFSQVELLCDG